MISMKMSDELLLIVVLAAFACSCREQVAPPVSPEPVPSPASPAEQPSTGTEQKGSAGPPKIVFTEQPEVRPAESALPASIPTSKFAPVGRLRVGDPAPPLMVSQWVLGTPIPGIEPGHIYVVEFWATWCGPCRTSMPHLSTLQEAYPEDVTVVGVTGEDAATVGKFLLEASPERVTWSEAIKYRVVLDRNGMTNAAYMQAAGQGGIPTAFIVGREGRIEWIGHPMQIDIPLAMVVTGDWDRETGLGQ